MNIQKQFISWITDKGIYKGYNLENIIEKILGFIDFDPFELNNDISSKEAIKENLKNAINHLKIDNEFLKFNSSHGNGIPLALIGKENYLKYLDEFTDDQIVNPFTPYFDLNGIEGYREVSKTTYNSSTKEAAWFYDTRSKLYYLIKLLGEKLDENFDLVYTEQPNAQKGRGKIYFKDYILAGFAPKPNLGDHLFIKVSFSNLKDRPVFAVDLDINFRKGESKFHSERNKIYSESLLEWAFDDSFPNNWNDLLNLITPAISKLNQQFKKMTSDKYELGLETNMMNNIPLNQILYGPPGTGKTYELQQIIQHWDLDEKTGNEKDYYSFAKNYTWWQIIALVLIDQPNSTVPEVAQHPLIIAKLGSSNVKSLNTRLWSSLQHHTVDNCANVKLVKRVGEKVFFKESNSKWRLDNATDFRSEFTSLIEDYEAFKKSDNVKAKSYTFTTCHQSLSYEDFIEGIKPDLNNSEILDNEDGESKNLIYEIRKGIFYNACEKAAQKAGFINLKDCLDKTKEERKTAFEKANNEGNIHVLFLDEINRCNVSGVFGELITLIEEDKRLGHKNEISDIVLPYSQDEFGVPANLYIIGTMNTADRSVEALDSALRRRFYFTEIMPEAQLLKEIIFSNFNLKEVLEVINGRIEILLDRDHAIGHSYFLNIESGDIKNLQSVFQNCIAPLLQEYFYHDYEKIALILGEGFVECIEPSESQISFAKFSKSIDVPTISRNFKLKNNIENIENAISLLLNKNE